MSFFGLGKEQKTGRYLFTVKDDSIGAEGAQAGVYLDALVMFMTIDTPEKYYILWMVSKDKKVLTHHINGDKTDVERNVDVLVDLRNDLCEAKFPSRKLFAATSMNDALDLLVHKIRVTNESAENIISKLLSKDK